MSRKSRAKAKAKLNKATDVVVMDGMPVLETPTGTPHEEVVETSKEVDASESVADNVENEIPVVELETTEDAPNCGANPVVESSEEDTKKTKKGKAITNKELFTEAENTAERKNEKESVISSDSSEPESVSTTEVDKAEEDSNPTPDNVAPVAPIKDSSDSTTDKVEQPVEKSSSKGNEKPIWYRSMAEQSFFRRHTNCVHPETGEKVELHGCNAFDSDGNSIDIKPKGDLVKPSVKGLSEKDKQKAYAYFDFQLKQRNDSVQKKRKAVYDKISPLLPKFLADHLKVVHVWNKENGKDKELGQTGILKGLQGGREHYTVLIDGIVDGKPKKIRRGFRFYSTTLPEGVEKAPQVPLREACEVEKEVDKKLLEDKRPNTFELPKGYIDALLNDKSDRRFHTILVWNSGGRQLSFLASPVEDQPSKFKWASMEMTMSGDYIIHNDAIRMQGSVEELLRTTVRLNQDNISDLTVVSIPVSDSDQMSLFMEVLGIGVDGNDNGKEQ